jgi:chromosome partitioning protein
MARVIGIINAKGGVGKTTTSINLGAYLAHMGKYVLLVDLDPQANASAGLGIRVPDDEANLYHSLIDEATPQDVIRKTSLVGLDVLPSAPSLAGANVELASMSEREYRLQKVINKVRTNYDFVIIDSPPSLGLLTINGLVASERLIIPVQCEYYALEGLSQLLKAIELVRDSINPQLKISGVLLTMYDKRNKLARDVMNEVHKNFPGNVFSAIIPRAVSLAEAPSFGKSILEFDQGSRAAHAYHELAREIVKLI